MFSIVCVCNNEKVFGELLLKSLKRQTEAYELIKVDGSEKGFSSAAEALNYGGRSAKGDLIMFVHQDVELLSDNWLSDAEKILNGLPALGIAGIAGAMDERGVMGNVTSGTPPVMAWSTPVSSPEEVQTLDECLVIIPKKMFDTLQFDEKACTGWHLYAVDYCLSCREMGYKAYVLPMKAYHKSDGIVGNKSTYTSLILKLGLSYTAYPAEYYRVLKNILGKHKKTGSIYTTCGRWDTSYPLSVQKSALVGLLKYPWTRSRRFFQKRH